MVLGGESIPRARGIMRWRMRGSRCGFGLNDLRGAFVAGERERVGLPDVHRCLRRRVRGTRCGFGVSDLRGTSGVEARGCLRWRVRGSRCGFGDKAGGRRGTG